MHPPFLDLSIVSRSRSPPSFFVSQEYQVESSLCMLKAKDEEIIITLNTKDEEYHTKLKGKDEEYLVMLNAKDEECLTKLNAKDEEYLIMVTGRDKDLRTISRRLSKLKVMPK